MDNYWVSGRVNLVEAVFTYLVGQTVTLSIMAQNHQQELYQHRVTWQQLISHFAS